MTTAAGSGFERPGDGDGVTRRAPVGVDTRHYSADDANTNTTTTPTPTPTPTPANGSADAAAQLRKAFRKKYRHVEAIHSESRPSCLSHDTTETPSFLGFRNLMVIVLGTPVPPLPRSVSPHVERRFADTDWPVAGNLRLVIENIQKVVASCRPVHAPAETEAGER